MNIMERVLPASPLVSYARENGLTIDSEQDPAQTIPGFSASIDNLVSLAAAQLEPALDDSHLPKLRSPRVESLSEPPEHFEVSQAAAHMMDLALALGRDPCPAILHRGPKSLVTLKIELPLLSSDHDNDVQQLLKECRARRGPELVADGLPSERLDASADEGIGFPAAAEFLRQRLYANIRKEKLDVSQKVVGWLEHAFKCDLPDSQELEDKQQRNQTRKNFSRPSMTPPMLSPVKEECPFIPDSEICQVPLTSDPDTLIEEDLAEVMKDLVRHDRLPSDSAPDLYKQGLDFSSPSHQSLETDIHGGCHNPIRIESPLSPRYDSVTKPLISQSLNEYADDIMTIFPGSAVGHAKPEESLDNDNVLTTRGYETMEKFYQGLYQERLDAADATARIPIPPMDFKHKPPDWHKLGLSPRAQLSSVCKEYEYAFKQPILSRQGHSKSQLRWIPFPTRLGRLDLQECIEHADAVQQLLSKTLADSPITSVDCIRYESGDVNLRRQNADIDEEELMPSLSISTARSEDNPSKSRLEQRSLNPATIDVPHKPSNTYSRRSMSEVHDSQHPALINDTVSTMLPDSTSKSATSTLLDNFIAMHAYKKRKLTSSSFFAKPETANLPSQDSQPGERQDANEVAPDQSTVVPPVMMTSAFVPLMRDPQPAARLIKSLNLDRAVFSRLELYYPTLSIIERDFDRWDTAMWNKGSITRSPKASPLSMEADLIVSPCTGLIVTSLIKVMQRSSCANHNGSINNFHESNNSIRSKVANTASRYEHLIILVSERNIMDESARVLSAAETEAIAEFSGFATALPTRAEVQYVGGGVDTLARWITFMIAKYTSSDVSEMVVQDESSWEIFLRQAGMNAYAAQVIPGLAQKVALKTATPAEHEIVGTDYKKSFWEGGLAAFMRMTPLQRVKNFRDVLGGDYVLNNVSKVLEARWA